MVLKIQLHFYMQLFYNICNILHFWYTDTTVMLKADCKTAQLHRL